MSGNLDDDLGEVELEIGNSPSKKRKPWSIKSKKKEKYAPMNSGGSCTISLDGPDDNILDIDKIQLKTRSHSSLTRNQSDMNANTNSITAENSQIKRKRSFSDPRHSSTITQTPTFASTGIYSLKVLCTAVICKNVDIYKGTTLSPPPEELKKLLKIMLHYNWINDSNLPFFLSESHTELDLSLNLSNNQLSDLSMSYITVCCPHLESLSFANWENITNNGWEIFCESSKPLLQNSLQKLILNGIKLSSKSLSNITTTFKSLKHLSLDGCENVKNLEVITQIGFAVGGFLRELSLKNLNLNSAAVESISKNFLVLEYLDLSVGYWDPHANYSSSEAIGSLSNISTLRKLYLGGMNFDNASISRICKSCTKLTVLDLTWLDITSEYVWKVQISEDALPDIANCRLLTELGLGYCHRIRNAQSLIACLNNLQFLQKLNLTSVPAVCDNLISQLVENCPNMRRLKLQNCIVNPCSLYSIGKYSSRLEYLDVRGKAIQTDSAWKAIAEGCPNLQTVLSNDMSPEARLNLQYHCSNLKVKLKRTM